MPGVLDDPRHADYLDLARAPLWFGTPDLPERVDRATIDREREAADAAGVVPFAAGAIAAARAKGGERLEVRSRYELLRAAALLIEQHAPDERELADALLVPKLPAKRDPR